MTRWRTLLGLTVVFAVVTIPIQDEIGRRFELVGVPTPLLIAIALGLAAVTVAIGEQAAAPTRSEAALVKRLNRRSSQLAERLVDDNKASVGAFFELFGPTDGDGRSVTPDDLPAGRSTLLVAAAGSGKTVALARLAVELCKRDRPLFYGHASELWPVGSSTAVPQPLDQALLAALHRRGITPLLAGQWVEEGAVRVVIDGLDETNFPATALVDALSAFHEDFGLCEVIAALRGGEGDVDGDGAVPRGAALTEGFERWTMPNVPKRVVRRQLEASDAYRRLPAENLARLEGVCANPLFLAMAVEVAHDGDAATTVPPATDIRRSIIEVAIRRRLAWTSRSEPGEEASFACWLARTMGRRSLGSTLELRSITWSMLPPRVQRMVRVLSLFLLGVPVFVAYVVVGVVLGLGYLPAVGASVQAIAVLYVVATLSPSGLRFITHREIVLRRRWSLPQVVALGSLSIQQMARRLVVGLVLGLPIGTIFSILITVFPDDLAGEPWPIWLSITTIPVLVLLFGALVGGLLSGALVGAAFGLSGSYVDALIGGVVAGGTGSLFFAIVDLGDVRTLPEVTANERVSRTITLSAWELSKFDVLVWSIFGLIYGGMNWLAHGGSAAWGYHGLGTGLSGAVLFGSIALVSPVSSYAIADFGLRRSHLLDRYTLNGMLARLIRAQILVSTGTGAAFRFAHPLIADFLAAVDPADGPPP